MQKKLNKNLIINSSMIGACLLGFLTLMILVLGGHKFCLDKFNLVVANNRNEFFNGFFKIFTYLGSFYVIAPLTLIGCIILWFVGKKKRMSVFFALAFAVTALANFIIKRIVKRPRPNLMIIAETGYSFPSGHAMLTLAFFMLLIYFIYKTLKNKALKISLISICALLTVLVGFSRIYLGVHYLTDILAGFLLTYAIVGVVLMIYNTKWFKFLNDGTAVQNKEKIQKN